MTYCERHWPLATRSDPATPTAWPKVSPEPTRATPPRDQSSTGARRCWAKALTLLTVASGTATPSSCACVTPHSDAVAQLAAHPLPWAAAEAAAVVAVADVRAAPPEKSSSSGGSSRHSTAHTTDATAVACRSFERTPRTMPAFGAGASEEEEEEDNERSEDASVDELANGDDGDDGDEGGVAASGMGAMRAARLVGGTASSVPLLIFVKAAPSVPLLIFVKGVVVYLLRGGA